MNTAQITSIPSMPDGVQVSSWRDGLGIVASIGCAIHCAAMPFVIAYLPAWGLSFLADEAFHKWMALICFLIAIAAFLPGIRKHGSWVPIGVGAIGLAFITYAAFGLAGLCCPSCEKATEAKLERANATGAACVESDCEHCEVCAAAKSDFPTQSDSVSSISNPGKKGLLSKLAPWITPLGGLLLVSAHLLNRRYGCQCGCCSSDKPSEDCSTE